MKNRDAYIVYLSIEGLFSLFFYTIITVNMVYQVEVAKLNPLHWYAGVDTSGNRGGRNPACAFSLILCASASPG